MEKSPLEKRRNRTGMSRVQLAIRAGMGVSTLQNIENGCLQRLGLLSSVRLARVLDVDDPGVLQTEYSEWRAAYARELAGKEDN
jgi:hypothetical protein